MGRILDLILRVNDRRLKSQLRTSQREIKAWGERTSSTVKTAFSAAIGGFAGFASIQGIAGLGKQVVATEEKLTRIGIQASYGADKLDELRTMAAKTGREFGLTRSEVLDAAGAIVDLEGAEGLSIEKMRVLSQASVATGANLKDLAGIAFALNNAFGVENADELSGVLSAVTNAGKNGSIPLNEMSTVLQQISADFKRLSFAGKAGAADLAAALQVARKGFGSSAEAGTGLKAFISQLDTAAPKLQAFGVRVFRTGKDGRKELRPIREVLDAIGNSRLVKDPRKMAKVFGSVEARKFLDTLIENRAQFEALAASAREANDVQKDAQDFLASSSGRLKIAMATARASLEAMITPERIEKFVSVVENQLVPAFEFVLDHAKEIGLAIAGIKMATMLRSTLQWGHAMSGLVTKAGGLSAILGATKGSALGALGGFLRFAGPIGLAATAAWGIYKAVKATRQESKRLTEEQIRQAELAGKSTPSKAIAQRRKAAQDLRNDVAASNELLEDDDFESKAKRAGYGKDFGRTGKRAMSEQDTEEMIGLRSHFFNTNGAMPEFQMARLEELLRAAGMLEEGQRFLPGARGVQAEKDARLSEARAHADEVFRNEAYGRRDFTAEGLDLGAFATERGLEGDEAKEFMQWFLKRAGGQTSSLAFKGDRRHIEGYGDAFMSQVGVRRTGLEVDAEGRVQRFERDGTLDSLGAFEGVRAMLETLVRHDQPTTIQDGAKAAAELLRSSDYAQVLEQAMTNALKNLNAVALGTVIGQAIANTSPRTPP